MKRPLRVELADEPKGTQEGFLCKVFSQRMGSREKEKMPKKERRIFSHKEFEGIFFSRDHPCNRFLIAHAA
jgi:hypothetical protein